MHVGSGEWRRDHVIAIRSCIVSGEPDQCLVALQDLKIGEGLRITESLVDIPDSAGVARVSQGCAHVGGIVDIVLKIGKVIVYQQHIGALEGSDVHPYGHTDPHRSTGQRDRALIIAGG